MTRKEHEARCLNECADAHGVSARSVRTWREKNDPRWLQWKLEWSKKHGFAQNIDETTPRSAGPAWLDDESAPVEKMPDDGFGEGIEAEILRTKAECRRLAIRAAWLEKAADFDAAALLHRILDAKRDGLRKLSQDNPDILAKLGDLMPRTVIFAYVAKVKMMLEAVPRRLMALVPDDLRDTLRPAIEAEMNAVLNAAKDIDLAA